MNDKKSQTLTILNELLEEVLQLDFECRPKHLNMAIEEAEGLLIAKGLRYRTPTINEGQLDKLNRDL
jgi:hypothetical protein